MRDEIVHDWDGRLDNVSRSFLTDSASSDRKIKEHDNFELTLYSLLSFIGAFFSLNSSKLIPEWSETE